MYKIKQLFATTIFPICLLTGPASLAGEVTGQYQSDISGKSDFDYFFGKKKYRKLDLLLHQDGVWINGVNKKYGTSISGIREGEQIIFEAGPSKPTSSFGVTGEWVVNADGTLAGTWKGDTGSYGGAGKWKLDKIGPLPSSVEITAMTREAPFSDLVLDDGNGKQLNYAGLMGDLTPVDINQRDLPLKTLKLKKLPEELTWLKTFDLDQNKKLSLFEVCNAWLVRFAELKSGSDLSRFIVHTGTQTSLEQAVCVSSYQRKAILADMVKLLDSVDSSSASRSSTVALMIHLSPSYAKDIDGGGSGGDGGGSGSDGGGNGM